MSRLTSLLGQTERKKGRTREDSEGSFVSGITENDSSSGSEGEGVDLASTNVEGNWHRKERSIDETESLYDTGFRDGAGIFFKGGKEEKGQVGVEVGELSCTGWREGLKERWVGINLRLVILLSHEPF